MEWQRERGGYHNDSPGAGAGVVEVARHAGMIKRKSVIHKSSTDETVILVGLHPGKIYFRCSQWQYIPGWLDIVYCTPVSCYMLWRNARFGARYTATPLLPQRSTDLWPSVLWASVRCRRPFPGLFDRHYTSFLLPARHDLRGSSQDTHTHTHTRLP